jgi:hypothetical protein
MGLMAGIGHNNGPELDGEVSWRRFAWTKAREALLPTLPIEVVRLRVRRAAELGLPYRTYAGVRASTGRDVIGFLFSSNALQVLRAGDGLPPDRVARLAALLAADRVAVVHPGPDMAAFGPPLDDVQAAPLFTDPWPAMRDRIAGILRARGRPSDGYLMIGETSGERDWAEAGRMAGFLTGERYFAA